MSVADAARADPALVRSALTAALRGWHVFPCAAGGKRPALRGNWQDLATTSPDVIRDWWNRAPYNIGIACGPPGLVVIDLDLPRAPAGDDDLDDGALFPLSGADRLARLARAPRGGNGTRRARMSWTPLPAGTTCIFPSRPAMRRPARGCGTPPG